MLRQLNRSILMLGSLAVLVAGCGAAPNATGVDAYGNPIDPSSYGNAYGTTDTYADDPYGSDPYDGTGSYGNTSGDTYGGTDTYTGASPSPSPSASPVGTDLTTLDDRPVLSASILEVKETGLLGLGKIIAKVEVENPGNTTLSGKLRVMFTDNGNPTANAQTKRVTLRPKERQTYTFTAKAWRLDDAEASIDTDEPKASKSEALN